MSYAKAPSINVVGGPLQPCSEEPLTGFYRNGCCDTSDMDSGNHTVCAVMTAEFRAFSKYVGNDLTTPRPEYMFPGLNPGDQWCLCAARFLQAHEEHVAPRVRLQSTHMKALDVVPLEILMEHAIEAEGSDDPGTSDRPGRSDGG